MQFDEQSSISLSECPYGPLTVLTELTVAVACKGCVEIVDWRARVSLIVIREVGVYAFGMALLPDGRLAVGGWNGSLQTGLVDSWAVSVTSAGRDSSAILGLIADTEGTLVVALKDGSINVLRRQTCEVKFTGSFTNYHYGCPLAIVGGRLLAVGDDGNILVIEQVGESK